MDDSLLSGVNGTDTERNRMLREIARGSKYLGNTRTDAQAHVFPPIYTHMQAWTSENIRACTHIHIDMHTYTNTYMHKQTINTGQSKNKIL